MPELQFWEGEVPCQPPYGQDSLQGPGPVSERKRIASVKSEYTTDLGCTTLLLGKVGVSEHQAPL